MPRSLKLYFLVVAAIAAPVQAADSPTRSDLPAVEVRVQSLNDLLVKFEYLGDLVGQGEPAKQAAALVKAFTDPMKGLEGIDPARPAGFYTVVTPGLVDSQAVLLVPIADEQAVIRLMKEKLNLKPVETAGVYEVRLPNVPVPIYFRFGDKYLFATAVSATAIEPERRLTPAAFFAEKSLAIATARVRFDRLPAELKKTTLAQFEMQVEQSKRENRPGETPAQKALRGLALDLAADAVQALSSDAKLLAVDLLIDPQSDEISAAVTLSAVEGSPLAATLAGAATPARSASFPARIKAPTLSAAVNLKLPQSYQERFSGLVDLVVREAVASSEPAAQALIRMVFESLAPTAKSGVFDAGFVLTKPSDSGTVDLLFSMRAVDTAGINTTIGKLADLIPPEIMAVKPGQADTKMITVHTMTSEQASAFNPIFGEKDVRVGTTTDLMLVGIGTDHAALTRAAGQKAEPTAPITVSVAVIGFATVFEKALSPEQIATIANDIFGEKPTAESDRIRLETTAGNPFSVQLRVTGKAVKFTVAIDQARKAAAAESTSGSR